MNYKKHKRKTIKIFYHSTCACKVRLCGLYLFWLTSSVCLGSGIHLYFLFIRENYPRRLVSSQSMNPSSSSSSSSYSDNPRRRHRETPKDNAMVEEAESRKRRLQEQAERREAQHERLAKRRRIILLEENPVAVTGVCLFCFHFTPFRKHSY